MAGARAGDASLGQAAERSHEASGEVSDEVSDWASDGLSDGVSDDYGAFKEGNLPSEAAGLTRAAEAAALEGSVDNVIDGPYSPAPTRLPSFAPHQVMPSPPPHPQQSQQPNRK